MSERGDAVTDADAGSAASFDVFYQQHWWPMLRLAVGLVDDRTLAEDVVQDAFAAMFRRRATVREPGADLAYLRTCVVNAARSQLRRRRTARRKLHLVCDDVAAAAADESSVLAAEGEAVRAAMLTLPERQREVLTLRYVSELDDADIAAATGLSPGGVRSAASRGLGRLRVALGEQL